MVEPSRSLSTFEDLAERIIRVDSPGLSTQQLETYDYARLSRPIYHLDEIREPSFS